MGTPLVARLDSELRDNSTDIIRSIVADGRAPGFERDTLLELARVLDNAQSAGQGGLFEPTETGPAQPLTLGPDHVD